MHGFLLIVTLLGASTGVRAPADTVGDGARRFLREARLAVERDSAPSATARWSAALARDSTDRGALFGLATLARLSNDDTTAVVLYHRLIRSSGRDGDAYVTYAHLGLARILFDRAALMAADTAARAALAGARARHDGAAEGEALLAVADARMDEDARIGRAYLDSALRALPTAATDLGAEVRCRRARLGFRSGDPRYPRDLADGLAYAHEVQAASCRGAVPADRGHRSLEPRTQRLGGRAAPALCRVAPHGAGPPLAGIHPGGAGGPVPRPGLVRGGPSRRAGLAGGVAGVALRAGRGTGDAHGRHAGVFTARPRLRHTGARSRVRPVRHARRFGGPDERALLAGEHRAGPGRSRRGRAGCTREVIGEARREQAVPWAIDLFHSLADIEILAGDYPAAAAALDTAARMLRSHGIEAWAPQQLYQRGRLALHRGDLDSAERIFRGYHRSLGDGEALRRHEVESYLADIRARRGDLAGAERDLTAAADQLDAWRAGLGDQRAPSVRLPGGRPRTRAMATRPWPA